jgi:hypothetical protein
MRHDSFKGKSLRCLKKFPANKVRQHTREVRVDDAGREIESAFRKAQAFGCLGKAFGLQKF